MLTFVGAPSTIRIKHYNIEFRISVYIPYETLFKLGDFIPLISDGIYEGCCPFNVYIKNHQILCIKNRGTRVLGNHLNGNKNVDQPKHNIYSQYGITSTIISENIIENSREDSILLQRANNTSDGFAHNNVSITNNLIRSENLTSDNTYAMIKIQPNATTLNFKSLLVSNNIFEHRVKSYPYNRYQSVLNLNQVADIVFSSNIIGLDYTISDTILKTSVTNLQVFGNSHQNYANFLFDRFELNGKFISIADTIRLTQDRTIADSTDSGEQGEICYDQNYLYIQSPQGWKRIPIPQEGWKPD